MKKEYIGLPVHLIKRYPNRKLYDTESNRYIHLQEVERLVDVGVPIQVIDSESGQDITAATLAQVLLAVSRRSVASVAISPLLLMIRAAKFPGEIAGAIGQMAAPGKDTDDMIRSPAAVSANDGEESPWAGAIERVARRLDIPQRSDLRRIESMLIALNAQVSVMLSARETVQDDDGGAMDDR